MSKITLQTIARGADPFGKPVWNACFEAQVQAVSFQIPVQFTSTGREELNLVAIARNGCALALRELADATEVWRLDDAELVRLIGIETTEQD